MKDFYKLPSGLASLEDAANIVSINYGPTYLIPISRKDTDKALKESLCELYKLTKQLQELGK